MDPEYPPLPPLTFHGFLPEGVHDTTLEVVCERFAFNPARAAIFAKLKRFLATAVSTGTFTRAYINGGFVTSKAVPEDCDVILQTAAPYGAEAFSAMRPFFDAGLDSLYVEYAVHLHFWCEGFPGGLSDFRRFFQYLRPQDAAPRGLQEGARKGIVRIRL